MTCGFFSLETLIVHAVLTIQKLLLGPLLVARLFLGLFELLQGQNDLIGLEYLVGKCEVLHLLKNLDEAAAVAIRPLLDIIEEKLRLRGAGTVLLGQQNQAVYELFDPDFTGFVFLFRIFEEILVDPDLPLQGLGNDHHVL